MAWEAPSYDRYLVPTNELAAIIMPVLDELSARHEQSNTHHNRDAGPHAEIIHRFARYLRQAEKSVPRRIYSVRVRETFGTTLDIADAFLLCIGKRIDETDLPVFPQNIPTSRELVKSRCPRMPEKERRKLARSLLRFSQGYLEEAADETTIEYIREQNEKRKERERSRREMTHEEELVAA